MIRFAATAGVGGPIEHEVAHMSISPGTEAHHVLPVVGQPGLDLIKHFEGYHARQEDGSCVAYLDVAGVPTIGWGCTEGVQLGMRWTKRQAEEALMRELAKASAAVDRLVTVEIWPEQRDALISFTYNVGIGALQKSTLLKKLNRGDYAGAEKEFERWSYATDARTGKKVIWKGLQRRRRAEAALFGDNDIVPVPVAEPSTASMPQAVETVPPKVPAASGGVGILAAIGTFFTDTLNGGWNWLLETASHFSLMSPVTSMFREAGVTVMPFLGGVIVLCGFMAAKKIWRKDEVKE